MKTRQRLLERFRNKRYRRAYVDTFTDAAIATQIKALREQRRLTQGDLAKLCGLKQSQISAFEDVDNSSWTVRTLKKLAKAFDLVLVVKFESYGNVLPDIDAFGRSALERPSFEEDPVFAGVTTTVEIGGTSREAAAEINAPDQIGVVVYAQNRFGVQRGLLHDVA